MVNVPGSENALPHRLVAVDKFLAEENMSLLTPNFECLLGS